MQVSIISRMASCSRPCVRGGSRNVEGGVLIVCMPVGSNFVVARELLSGSA